MLNKVIGADFEFAWGPMARIISQCNTESNDIKNGTPHTTCGVPFFYGCSSVRFMNIHIVRSAMNVRSIRILLLFCKNDAKIACKLLV